MQRCQLSYMCMMDVGTAVANALKPTDNYVLGIRHADANVLGLAGNCVESLRHADARVLT